MPAPVAPPGVGFDPEARFALAVTWGFLVKCVARAGHRIGPGPFRDLRHEYRRGLSELGRAGAFRVFKHAAASWVALVGRCGFCGEPPHDTGPVRCPILLEDGPDAPR